VFTNAKGGPVNRRNLLPRHLKPTVRKLRLPETVDLRSFRTMHSSLMSGIGVRPEVTPTPEGWPLLMGAPEWVPPNQGIRNDLPGS
jgi:hypothetical protein